MDIEERAGPDPECGNAISQTSEPLPEVVVELMKNVFKETHGGEMSQEDRDFLGIPPCSGKCCPDPL